MVLDRYDARMKRITISLPDDLAARLEREAARRSVSASAVVRSALADALGAGLEGTRRPLPFPVLGNSGVADTSQRVEEILAHEWGGADARDR